MELSGAHGELLLIIGPPAVGKMTVGRAVCARSDFRIFHHHASIEPLLDVFDYGTTAFTRLNLEIRRRVIVEAAASGTRLVFTFVWGVDLVEDAEYVIELVRPHADAGRRVAAVELYADLQTRLDRNGTAERLAHKPSKRDVAWSDDNVRSLEEHRLNTDPDQPSVADPGERAMARPSSPPVASEKAATPTQPTAPSTPAAPSAVSSRRRPPPEKTWAGGVVDTTTACTRAV